MTTRPRPRRPRQHPLLALFGPRRASTSLPDLRGSSSPFELHVWHFLFNTSLPDSQFCTPSSFHSLEYMIFLCIFSPFVGKRALLNQRFGRFTARRGALDPLPWNDYFTQELYLKVSRPTENVVYHVYITPPTAKGPLLVTHHGAGSSGLSFALFASEVRKALPNAGVLSFDARGHGETVVETLVDPSENNVLDLSLNTLSGDLLDVINVTKTEMAWPELPGLVLIGHSVGGAVVTDVAASGKLGDAVLGYAVLDVVEGSAIDALQSMQSYISTRPKTFSSITSGIEWQ